MSTMDLLGSCPELTLKTVCCTCLSVDRKLSQLCRIADGVNNLYYMLSYDPDAFRQGFYKGSSSLFICWECLALMNRLSKFREQACAVQKKLSLIAEGQADLKSPHHSHSKLSTHYTKEYNYIFIYDNINDNFIDCGPDLDTKCLDVDSKCTDMDSISGSEVDDIPLSELPNKKYITDKEISRKIKLPSKKTKSKFKEKVKIKSIIDFKKYFSTAQMSEEEMKEVYDKQRAVVDNVESLSKCEYCEQGFKSNFELDKHNLAFHTEKPKHTKCDICQVYIRNSLFASHRSNHYKLHTCCFCEHTVYSVTDIIQHLREGHAIRNEELDDVWTKMRKSSTIKNPGSKPRRNPAMLDKRTPFGFSCTECDKYFDNKNKRYKHIQRYHREGFKCNVCDKRFAFKNNLTKHEQIHSSLPREQCATCGKLVRKDLAHIHAQTHGPRSPHACVPCGKRFVSRASYQHHLKYASVHATHDILKYKCKSCSKGYRSQGELRDHVNFQHMGQTQHKCPICDKALATPRCITRHVRRAHHGLNENVKDKMCQTCGKAFRDKKGLREHELIHTGERPLTCSECGRSFRQRASLYTHRRRVHHILPTRGPLKLTVTEKKST